MAARRPARGGAQRKVCQVCRTLCRCLRQPRRPRGRSDGAPEPRRARVSAASTSVGSVWSVVSVNAWSSRRAVADDDPMRGAAARAAKPPAELQDRHESAPPATRRARTGQEGKEQKARCVGVSASFVAVSSRMLAGKMKAGATSARRRHGAARALSHTPRRRAPGHSLSLSLTQRTRRCEGKRRRASQGTRPENAQEA
jgi:hypothetical protein